MIDFTQYMAAQALISYSRKDSEQANELVAYLEGEGIHVWIDKTGLAASSHWAADITRAIDGCPNFIILLSKNSIQSAEVLRELNLASNRRKNIIPVQIDSTPLTPAFEYLLAGLQYTNFKDKEVLAQRIRLGKKAGAHVLKPKRNRAILVVLLLLAGAGGYLLYNVEEKPPFAFASKSKEANRLYKKGAEYLKMHNDDSIRYSLTLFDEALTIDSNFALAYADKAFAYHALAHKDEDLLDSALHYAYLALHHEPKLAHAHVTIASAYYEQEEYDLALDAIEASLEIDSDAKSLSFAGVVHAMLGDTNKAIEHQLHALRRKHDYADPYVRVEPLLRQRQARKELRHMSDSAIRHIKKALRHTRDSVALMTSLARFHFYRRDTNEFRSIHSEIRERELTAEGHYEAACLSALLGDDKLALKHLEQAVAQGFDRKSDLTRNIELASLRNNASFRTLTSKMP